MEVFDTLEQIKSQIEDYLISTKEELEAFRIKYLGSKNELKPLFGKIKDVPNEQKKDFGLKMNELKSTAEEKYQALSKKLASDALVDEAQNIDLTMPSAHIPTGSEHPVAKTLNKIIEIFQRIGFEVAEDREIEDDWHNFTAMNTPEDHPARDMQDTFYLLNDPSHLLRTHTSSVQSRVMENSQPPIRIIAPGRVYRNETISARSHCQFHQVEGLYIDKKVSFADMKSTLLYFAQSLFGKETAIRLRPSYFPFTEPSAEMDVYWGLENEVDYRMTKGTGWLEVLGCGMVDPQVLINCEIDPEEYTGYAFGIGIERLALFLHRISDIRLLFENDIRFLKQFSSIS